MILYRYFAWRFLKAFAGVFGTFLGIVLMIEVVEQISSFDSGVVGFAEILGLSFLHLPSLMYPILPLVVMLAALVLFLGLARSSELVVTRAAGRSGMKSLVAPVVVALVLGILAVAVFNPIVAATSKQFELTVSHYASGKESVLSISQEGLWLRQGGDEGQTVIRAQGSNLDGTKLVDVSFFSFTATGTPMTRTQATSAELTQGAWILKDAKKWQLLGSVNPERDAQRYDELRIESNLTREQIRDSFGTPSSIPIWDLPAFIERLDHAGFSARLHRVWLQTELALPLLLVAMVLIGAGFTMRHTRFGGTGPMVLAAVLVGFTLFFIRNFAQVLGENGQLPVYLAAWSPPIAAILMALALILHQEDG
ncbi:MAG: LPS export ABC transporter permease LptG [Marinosulfonomonas sp.]|nr:LPS export ABC transporter permease LptG [Marinosulfonomonas sp.]